MSSQTNVQSNKCPVEQMASQTNGQSNKCPVEQMFSQTNTYLVEQMMGQTSVWLNKKLSTSVTNMKEKFYEIVTGSSVNLLEKQKNTDMVSPTAAIKAKHD